MKISLILPPCTEKELYGDFAGSNPVLPPLDIAYIASYLEQEGHDVSLYDCFAEGISFEILYDWIKNNIPNLIIMTVDFPTLSSPLISKAYQVAKLCKEIDPEIKVALYGYYPNKFPENVLAKENIDFVIRGEGEITAAELCRGLLDECKFEDIEGLGYKYNDTIVVNKSRGYIENLDTLPLPAYHLLNIEKYHLCPTSRKKRRQMTILSSRGCPFDCYLCTSPLFWNRKWRAHSPDYILKNLDCLNQKYGITDFQFRDETFTVNRKRVIDTCSLLIEKKRKYNWSCYSTFNLIDEELIQIMKRAGCYQIDLGVETGSGKILKEYKKVDKNIVKQMVGIMKKYRIETRLFFIIGPPSETKEDVEETINFAIELDPDYVLFSPAAAYPGNELYDRLKRNGQKLPDFENRIFTDNEAVCDLPGFDKQYINAMVAVAFKRFYMRPKYLFKRIVSTKSIHDLKSYCDGGIPLLKYLINRKKVSTTQN